MGWVYLPGQEDLNSQQSLPLQALAFRCGAWLTWRGRRQRPSTWLRRWKKGGYLKRLSGMTLTPSQLVDLQDKWISSLRRPPASRTRLQESALEMLTNVAGMLEEGLWPPVYASSVKADRDLFGSKTCRDGSREAGLSPSEMSYSQWVTSARNLSSSVRKTLGLRMKGIGSGLWPTSTIAIAKQGQNNPDGKRGQTLIGAARGQNWPTSRASEAMGKPLRMNRRKPTRLEESVVNWRTTLVKDGQRNGIPWSRQVDSLCKEAVNWATIIVQDSERGGSRKKPEVYLNNQVCHFFNQGAKEPKTHGSGSLTSFLNSRLRLNPRFCEWQMGLIPGWTDYACVEDRWFHWWLQWHSSLLREYMELISGITQESGENSP